MDRLWDGLTRVAYFAILAGCAMLMVAAIIVTAEVMVRKAIPDLITLAGWVGTLLGFQTLKGTADAATWVRNNLGFSGSDEISGYLFAIGTTWSMSHVLITRGHVRIDVLYERLPAALRPTLDLLALICLAVFVGALVERAFNVSWTNLIENNRSNSPWRVPLAWPQLPWMAGIVLFFVTIVAAILRVVLAMLRGDYATVRATAGVSSQDEEIESELKGLGIEAPHAGKV